MSGVIVWLGASQTILVSTQVSGTVTVVAGLSVSAQVSGTVTAILPGSTTGSSGMSGVLVWLGASQTILVSTQISGTVTISNGASITIQQGASVSAVVSGTVTALLPGSTTGSSGMSGVLVWLGASQTIIVSTQVSGTVSVVAGLSVSAVVSGTVSISGALITTAVPSASATGLVIWVGGGQSTTAFPVVITGTVTAGAGTTVVSLTGSALVSGTVTVSNGVTVNVSGILITTTGVTTGTAQAVWIMNPTTVTVTIAGTTTGTVSLLSIVPVVTQTSVSVSGIPIWFAPGALVSISGTGVVSVVPGLSVSAVVSGTVTVGGTLTTVNSILTIVTVLGTQIVSVVPGLSVSAVVSGTVTVPEIGRTQIMIVITSTVMLGGTTAAFTVYQGSIQTVAGVTVWVVPGGKTFRALNVAVILKNSITTTPCAGIISLFVSAATPTHTSACPRVAQLFVAVQNASAIGEGNINIISGDVAAGVTIGVGVKATTASATMWEAVVHGYLFP
jgi:hypothetical protein